MPHLCVIFEATGPYNAIGKIAMAEAESALDAGWRVSIVAKRLHESLQGRVEWLKLYVPPRGFALQWLTARRFIGRALGDRSRFDVIHGHQPQVADWCDVFECHFLTRAAHDRDCLLDARGARRAAEWAQKRLVLAAEDRHYARWNPATHLLFNSELTRRAFDRYYGLPPRHEVLIYPSPPWHPVEPSERVAARASLGVSAGARVLGFLGGLHERKGYRRVIDGLRGARDLTLLMGGLHSDGFDAPELAGHFRSVGLRDDTPQFYAACDAIVVASHFEPYGYVCSEAAARGVPTIATDEVGALPHLLEYGAGARWDGGPTLPQVARAVFDEPRRFRDGCRAYTEALSPESRRTRLLELYDGIATRRRAAKGATGPSAAVDLVAAGTVGEAT